MIIQRVENNEGYDIATIFLQQGLNRRAYIEMLVSLMKPAIEALDVILLIAFCSFPHGTQDAGISRDHVTHHVVFHAVAFEAASGLSWRLGFIFY